MNFLESLFNQPPAAPFDASRQGNLARLAGGVAGNLPANILDQVSQAPAQIAPQQSEQPPRVRRSFIDTIGQIADVFARVGGAEPLFQPTIDAREDRQRQLEIEDLRKQQIGQQIGQGDDEARARQLSMAGRAVQGLKAVITSGGNFEAAWPLLAQQAGIPPDQAEQMAQFFRENPEGIDAFISLALGPEQNAQFGVQPFFAQDEQGNLQAFQLGRDGTQRRIELGEGLSPVDPLKFVNLGDRQAGIGSQSGQVRTVLENGVAPNTQATNETRVAIARENNQVRSAIAQEKIAQNEPIAGLQPKEIAKREAAFPKVSASFRTAQNEIDKQIRDLIELRDSPGLDNITGAIQGRIPIHLLPSSNAAQALLDTILARGGFAALQEMRNNSPTGGALGNVSNAEGERLQNSVASLNKAQDGADFRRAINKYIADLRFSKSNLGQAFDETYAYRDQLQPDQSPQDFGQQQQQLSPIAQERARRQRLRQGGQ